MINYPIDIFGQPVYGIVELLGITIVKIEIFIAQTSLYIDALSVYFIT
jgi:hypothetical protein